MIAEFWPLLTDSSRKKTDFGVDIAIVFAVDLFSGSVRNIRTLRQRNSGRFSIPLNIGILSSESEQVLARHRRPRLAHDRASADRRAE